MRDIFKMVIALVTFQWLFGGDNKEGGCLGCSGCGCSTFGTILLIIIIALIINYL